MTKKRIAVLTGAGVSAESGFSTFRDTGGLWEQYDVNDVASIEGWYRNRGLVLDFYNDLRSKLKEASPNAAHKAIAALESDFEVDVTHRMSIISMRGPDLPVYCICTANLPRSDRSRVTMSGTTVRTS